MLGFRIGGMGHAARNFHADLMARMGYGARARRIQELFLAGRREEAVAAVPDAFADEISLVGPFARSAERPELWRAGPVTDLLVTSPTRTPSGSWPNSTPGPTCGGQSQARWASHSSSSARSPSTSVLPASGARRR